MGYLYRHSLSSENMIGGLGALTNKNEETKKNTKESKGGKNKKAKSKKGKESNATSKSGKEKSSAASNALISNSD